MPSLRIRALTHPITAEVSIPGSKSYTIRALLMAAMTRGEVVIKNPLFSDDTEAMLKCLQQLGIEIQVEADRVVVKGDHRDIEEREHDLNVDLSGTTMRFLLAFLCAVPGTKTLQGGHGLNLRPVRDLVDGLRQLGARIEYTGVEGCPPVRILSSQLNPGIARLSGSISSQYFTALLLIAPLIGGVTLEVIGEQISRSYIDMTIDSMKQFGVTVTNQGYRAYLVNGEQAYNLREYLVEGDYSGAAYFLAIAALTHSEITLHNLNPASLQGDMQFVKILQDMGSTVYFSGNSLTIRGCGVKPVAIDMQNCPDQAQTLAVLAAFANGTSILSGVQSLRVKETERVVALENELAKMGIANSSTHDTLTINGGAPHPAAIDTYGDHRMAMSFAVAGTRLDGMVINDPQVVTKTFPHFFDELQRMGISIEHDDQLPA